VTFVDGQRRFLIRRDGWVQPLLWLVGLVGDSNSYAAIEGEQLRVRFGWFFNHTCALGDIEGVEAISWAWYRGLGWRASFSGLAGVVGSYRGVVAIRFRRRQRIGGIVPFVKLSCDRLALSLHEPEEFIAALNRALAPG
jgi:hypothetical protein